MRRVPNKDLNDVVEGLVELGWTFESRRRHFVVRSPSGRESLTLHLGGRVTSFELVKRFRATLRRAREAAP